MNSLENPIQHGKNSEVMMLPEIKVQEERGATLLSILLKAYDSDRGGHEHGLTDEVGKFFEQNPLDKKSTKFLDEIRALQDGGTDEEVLYNIALTYERPERQEELFDFIKKHKDYISNAQELHDNLLDILKQLENNLPSGLKRSFTEVIAGDIQKRNQAIQEVQERIKNLIDFFKPSSKTTKVDKLTILPTDFLCRKESGGAFQFNNETMLLSHIDNPNNLEHEFLHTVINPIVDRLSETLTEKQKQKISRLASGRLKAEEGYGQEYYSLLCEEFIRTYNDVFQQNEKPLAYEDFAQQIASSDEKQFMIMLEKREDFKKRCAQLQITTFEDFKNKSREYFDAFKKNNLREIIFEFYQDFAKEKEKNPDVAFEEFALKEFNNRI